MKTNGPMARSYLYWLSMALTVIIWSVVTTAAEVIDYPTSPSVWPDYCPKIKAMLSDDLESTPPSFDELVSGITETGGPFIDVVGRKFPFVEGQVDIVWATIGSPNSHIYFKNHDGVSIIVEESAARQYMLPQAGYKKEEQSTDVQMLSEEELRYEGLLNRPSMLRCTVDDFYSDVRVFSSLMMWFGEATRNVQGRSIIRSAGYRGFAEIQRVSGAPPEGDRDEIEIVFFNEKEVFRISYIVPRSNLQLRNRVVAAVIRASEDY